jgi:hypothetical protein
MSTFFGTMMYEMARSNNGKETHLIWPVREGSLVKKRTYQVEPSRRVKPPPFASLKGKLRERSVAIGSEILRFAEA